MSKRHVRLLIFHLLLNLSEYKTFMCTHDMNKLPVSKHDMNSQFGVIFKLIETLNNNYLEDKLSNIFLIIVT